MSSEKIIIVGSGPAAHTAAIYAGRAGLEPLVFEGFMAGGVAAGGQLTTTTEVFNFPGFPGGISGIDLMSAMREQSIENGARIETKTVSKVDLSKSPFVVTTDENKTYEASSLIIATGATAKRMHLPKEDLFWQKGISACAVCDGALPLFRNKPVFMVGGGDVACEEALYMTKYASTVFLAVRRDVMRASKSMQDRVNQNPKITVLYNHVPVDVDGDSILRKIFLKNTQTGEIREMEASGLFYGIGHTPNTGFLERQVKLDEEGYVVTKSGSTKTSVEGVFAAGDVCDKVYRQAIVASGSGCMAALDCERYLSENGI